MSVVAISSCLIAPCLSTAQAENDDIYREIKANPSPKTASLFITPIKDRSGEKLIIDLVVDPGGEDVNAIDTEISFDKDRLKLIDISHDKSFCEFFIEEDVSVDGKIKLSCLAPFPGIKEIRNVYTLTFEKKDKGETEIRLSPRSMVLANDGYGTNIVREIKNQKINLEQ